MAKVPKRIILPGLDLIKDKATRDVFHSILSAIEEGHKYYADDLTKRVITIDDGDVTPDVKGAGDVGVFQTANTGGTVITDFDNAFDGQIIILIIKDGNTSIADAGNFKLSAAFAPNADDTITLAYSATDAVWYEVSRSAN